MLKNHFKIAFRNLLRYKLHSSINVMGLAIGISACLVIFLLVHHQRSFDTFHPDKERIYRVYTVYSGLFDATNSGIAFPIPDAIRKECTGVEAVGHFMTFSNLKISLGAQKEQGKVFEKQNKVVAAEPDYFRVFDSYHWLAGTPQTALSEPFKVVLTESRARFYFGNIEPRAALGQEINYNDSLLLTVSGIVSDLPKQTDLNFTDFISFSTISQSWLKNDVGGLEGMKEWGSTTSSSQVFIKLDKTTQTERLSKQLAQLVKKYQVDKDPKLKLVYPLQALADLRYSTIGIFNDSLAPANRKTLSALALVAGLLLLIACINFINLATAQSIQRSKEVGVRKVLGGTRGVLISQFLGETLVITLVAMLFSIALAKGAMVFFREFLPEGLTFNLFNPSVLVFIGAVLLLVSVLAGLYPAFVLSGFRPALALKAKLSSKGSGSGVEWLRKGLIVFQFTFSLALIAGTLIIGRQIKFMQNAEMGFNADAVVHFRPPFQYESEKKTLLSNQIRQLIGVKGVSIHADAPASQGINTRIFNFKGKKETEDHEFLVKGADTAYLNLYDITLLAGRNLLHADSTREYLINETALKQLGFKHPQEALGKNLIEDKTEYPIVGVVKDFHSRSLHEPIRPLVLAISPLGQRRELSLKLATQGKGTDSFKATMEQVEQSWKAVYPGEKFEYTFVDQDIAKFYENEQRTSKIMSAATGIAIFISCIGLFGLVSFMIGRRTKEIGVRKILGASISNIVALLSKDLLLLVGISILLGSPIAWYFAQQWLKDFAFHIAIEWWMFAAAGGLAIAFALLTLSYQAIRAAIVNPVDSLRNE